MTSPTFAEIYSALLRWDVCDDPKLKADRWLEFRALTKSAFMLRHLIIALEEGQPNALKLLNHVVNLGMDNERKAAVEAAEEKTWFAGFQRRAEAGLFLSSWSEP